MTSEPEFHFGLKRVNEHGFTCCGKPVGCTMLHEGCAFRSHPWKRENALRNELAALRKFVRMVAEDDSLHGTILEAEAKQLLFVYAEDER